MRLFICVTFEPLTDSPREIITSRAIVVFAFEKKNISSLDGRRGHDDGGGEKRDPSNTRRTDENNIANDCRARALNLIRTQCAAAARMWEIVPTIAPLK